MFKVGVKGIFPGERLRNATSRVKVTPVDSEVEAGTLNRVSFCLSRIIC
jgi:hypothetical protein